MEKQILCIKWGRAYSPEYVNILYGMAARHTTGQLAFYCLTDDSTGIRREVKCLPLPSLDCDIPADAPGKWRKSVLWSHDLFGLKGTALYIDLDSVIVDNIDGYFGFGDPADVVVARNWLSRIRRRGQTSVFRFPIGQHGYMLDRLRANSLEMTRSYRWEQNYVTEGIRGGVKYWPERWTRHFRLHCAGPWPVRFFRKPQLPREAKIVTFPGSYPKPADAALGRWSHEQTSPLLQVHLRRVWERFRLADDGWRQQFKHFMRPASWLQENWRP